MKCQLVGYNADTIKDKETGEAVDVLSLYLIRNSTLREPNAVGKVAVVTTSYGAQVEKINEAVELKVGEVYDCELNTFKGKTYLNDISKA